MFIKYGADTVATMFTEEYQVDYYEVIDKCVHFVYEKVWNFMNFAISEEILRVQENRTGIFTRDRKLNFIAHYIRNRWSSIPNFNYKK
ncbi:TPA: hypothetical protein IV336_002557 [Enterococcus faecium]|nr:hypothetical protein [Enterococcus faecium]